MSNGCSTKKNQLKNRRNLTSDPVETIHNKQKKKKKQNVNMEGIFSIIKVYCHYISYAITIQKVHKKVKQINKGITRKPSSQYRRKANFITNQSCLGNSRWHRAKNQFTIVTNKPRKSTHFINKLQIFIFSQNFPGDLKNREEKELSENWRTWRWGTGNKLTYLPVPIKNTKNYRK